MSARIRLPTLLVAALVLLLALLVADRILALVDRAAALPPAAAWFAGAIAVALAAGALWLGWRLWHPRPRRAAPVIDRAGIEARLERLEADGDDTGALRGELADLDARRATGLIHAAVFGEISAGKSSLIRALAPAAGARVDVIGGTTLTVELVDAALPGGQPLRLADVPGSREAGGEAREALARDEALRAHVVLYVTAGDVTRSQGEEITWLGRFGKPLLLVLNKADQWSTAERDALLARLRERLGDRVDAIVATSAGGTEHFQRRLPDGRSESVTRTRAADITALQQALARLAAADAAALETARERAVLAGLHARVGDAEAARREREGRRIVARYTRRAVVGALAAVAPGSDLVIQGVLATAMIRELAALHELRVSELEADAFLRAARLNLRTSTTVILAISGNAMKAFPGLGTLGGGVAHAFAYALIFDSLGKALTESMAARNRLDLDDAGARLSVLMAGADADRLQRLAALTVDALRHGADVPPRAEP